MMTEIVASETVEEDDDIEAEDDISETLDNQKGNATFFYALQYFQKIS